MPRFILPVALFAALASPLLAQEEATLTEFLPDSVATAPDTIPWGSRLWIPAHPANKLPVDRITDLLALEPGVASLNDGDLSVRGAGVDANAVYLDGVPITPAHRGFRSALAGGSWFGALGSGLRVGTNSFSELGFERGAGPGEFGNARGGILEISGPTPPTDARGFSVGAGYATDEILGSQNGLGFNRITLDGGGRAGRFSASLAGVLEGQSTARLGLEQNASPIYVRSEIDTTIGGVDIYRFKASGGVRIPSSAVSSYTLLGSMGYAISGRHRVALTLGASQNQAREFDYFTVDVPKNQFADRIWSGVITGSWYGRLKESASLVLDAEAHVSWQTDRETDGPLTVGGADHTADPFGGFMVAPVDFLFDAGNFPVDQDLVNGYLTGQGPWGPFPGPVYPTLYYAGMANPYATRAPAFSSGGGPAGFLTQSEENRWVFKPAIDARFGRHRVRLGGEFATYDVAYGRTPLDQFFFGNVYIGSPNRQAIFGDYTVQLEQLRIAVGARYDRFKSGAAHADFPATFTRPGFDPNNPDAAMTPDQSHARLSPRINVQTNLGRGAAVFASAGALAQMPDLAAVYSGMNMDIAFTGGGYTFGSDLDFERSTIVELGVRYRTPHGTEVSLTGWSRKDDDVVTQTFDQQVNPADGISTAVLRYHNKFGISARGVELRGAAALGARGSAWLSYSYTDSDIETNGLFPSEFPSQENRPHSVSGAVAYETGPASEWLGGVFRRTGVFVTGRYAAGTAYTACPNDSVATSNQVCFAGNPGPFNGARLPALKLLDLKLTRGFALGSAELTAFIDMRNLLNTTNLIQVFSSSGTTKSATERRRFVEKDTVQWAGEARQNGVYLPNGSIDLSFGGAQDPRTGCGVWVEGVGTPNPANCVYLILTEERFGDGDHIFTPQEQARTSGALYDVIRGQQYFTGPGRRVRLGVEVRF